MPIPRARASRFGSSIEEIPRSFYPILAVKLSEEHFWIANQDFSGKLGLRFARFRDIVIQILDRPAQITWKDDDLPILRYDKNKRAHYWVIGVSAPAVVTGI